MVDSEFSKAASAGDIAKGRAFHPGFVLVRGLGLSIVSDVLSDNCSTSPCKSVHFILNNMALLLPYAVMAKPAYGEQTCGREFTIN